MTQRWWFPLIYRKPFIFLIRIGMRIAFYLGAIQDYFRRSPMTIRIAVVGDLSLQDPARLERVMAAAAADSDILVQMGDINPGYSVVQKYINLGKPYSVFVVCG